MVTTEFCVLTISQQEIVFLMYKRNYNLKNIYLTTHDITVDYIDEILPFLRFLGTSLKQKFENSDIIQLSSR